MRMSSPCFLTLRMVCLTICLIGQLRAETVDYQKMSLADFILHQMNLPSELDHHSAAEDFFKAHAQSLSKLRQEGLDLLINENDQNLLIGLGGMWPYLNYHDPKILLPILRKRTEIRDTVASWMIQYLIDYGDPEDMPLLEKIWDRIFEARFYNEARKTSPKYERERENHFRYKGYAIEKMKRRLAKDALAREIPPKVHDTNQAAPMPVPPSAAQDPGQTKEKAKISPDSKGK